MHKSSVNYLVQSFFSEFLLFQEKFETNKIYLFDTTVISALSVVLFSSDPILIEVHNNNTVILLNNRWILIDSANHKVSKKGAKSINFEEKKPSLSQFQFSVDC